jgi:hypothetical protein
MYAFASVKFSFSIGGIFLSNNTTVIGPGRKYDKHKEPVQVRGVAIDTAAWSVISDGKDHQNTVVASKSRGVMTDEFIGDSPACSIPDVYTIGYVGTIDMSERRMTANTARRTK